MRGGGHTRRRAYKAACRGAAASGDRGARRRLSGSHVHSVTGVASLLGEHSRHRRARVPCTRRDSCTRAVPSESLPSRCADAASLSICRDHRLPRPPPAPSRGPGSRPVTAACAPPSVRARPSGTFSRPWKPSTVATSTPSSPAACPTTRTPARSSAVARWRSTARASAACSSVCVGRALFRGRPRHGRACARPTGGPLCCPHAGRMPAWPGRH
jgi:hypothetical protein